MGLRCLLGHDYATPELQRDREEQGGEVVVTVREVKTCTRCGDERVVSENKEVTSISTPDEIEELADEADTDATVEHAPDVESAGAGRSADEAAAGGTADAPASGEDGAEFVEDDPADDAPAPDAADEGGTPDAPAAEASADDPPAESGPTAEEDDGVILEDDDEVPAERGHGEWPAADDVRGAEEPTPTLAEVRNAADDDDEAADEPASEADGAEVVSETEHDRAQWPNQTDDDEGYAAEPGDGSPTNVPFSGFSPERPGDVAEVEDVTEGAPGHDAEVVRNGSGDGQHAGQITRAAELDATTGPGGDPTAYVCPECGLRRPAGDSSMRAGDICPECKRGYITEEGG